MDLSATVAWPLDQVFGCLADPWRLGDWLLEVRGVGAAPTLFLGLGVTFTLTLQAESRECAASGEIIAYEPPWLAAYRLFAEEQIHILRLTCRACPEGTRVQIHQADGKNPLRVDLARLERALAADGTRHRGDERTAFGRSPHGRKEGDAGTYDACEPKPQVGIEPTPSAQERIQP
jgi:hypothetical protein